MTCPQWISTLFAEGRAISADNVKAIVMSPAVTQVPVLETLPIDLSAYDALLADHALLGKVGT
jgi:hypothetical protein